METNTETSTPISRFKSKLQSGVVQLGDVLQKLDYAPQTKADESRSYSDGTRSGDVFRMHDDGIGYDVLHPTKGWRRISKRRVFAQHRLAAVFDRGMTGNLERASIRSRIAKAVEAMKGADQAEEV